MVRLKEMSRLKQEAGIPISIPYGSIKSNRGYVLRGGNRISIPYGSIKSRPEILPNHC